MPGQYLENVTDVGSILRQRRRCLQTYSDRPRIYKDGTQSQMKSIKIHCNHC